MINSESISGAEAIYQAMIEYYKGDPKRIQHFIKVNALAKYIALRENLSDDDLYITDIASLVHDIGIKNAELKYNSSSGKYQEQEGAQEVEKLLHQYEIDPTVVDRVKYLVAHHHTYTDIDGLDYQILVEADFLVNCYEDQYPQEKILNVRDKIFKTQTGIELLNTLYALPTE